MASDGYGKARVSGMRGGDYGTVTTGDMPITVDVEYEIINDTRSIAPNLTDLVSQIIPTFRSLFRRVKDGNTQ